MFLLNPQDLALQTFSLLTPVKRYQYSSVIGFSEVVGKQFCWNVRLQLIQILITRQGIGH